MKMRMFFKSILLLLVTANALPAFAQEKSEGTGITVSAWKAQVPAFLIEKEEKPIEEEKLIFVAREQELYKLERLLEYSLL